MLSDAQLHILPPIRKKPEFSFSYSKKACPEIIAEKGAVQIVFVLLKHDMLSNLLGLRT